MKIPKGMMNPLELLNSRLNQTQGLPDSKRDNASVSFEKLLEHRISQIEQNNIMPDKSPPIDRNSLSQLTEIIQKQMNDSLFNAFGDSDRNSSSRESQLNSINLMRLQHLMNTAISGSNTKTIPGETEAPLSKTEIEKVIEEVSVKYNVDPALTKAVVRAESDFNPGCTSSKGAMGLMQLMPPTARELGVQNPYNPYENIDGGTRYLKQLLDRYEGDTNLALSAYNWGMGNVERNPGKLPQETRTYISRVNRYYQDAKTG